MITTSGTPQSQRMMLFMIGVSVEWIGLYIGDAGRRRLREKPVRARGRVPTVSLGLGRCLRGGAGESGCSSIQVAKVLETAVFGKRRSEKALISKS